MIIKSFFGKVSAKSAAIATTAVAVVAIPAVLNAWGPNRPTYTIEQPADHITFNSITNNPNFGDERNFVTVREKGAGTWEDSKSVQPGKEYEVSIYVHNNASANLNLVAQNALAKATVPTTTGKSIDIQGFVNASNATPNEVYDHATLTSDQDFNLAYVNGSARYYNNVFGKYGAGAGTQLPDSIVTSTGAKLGYDKLDGNIPGCFQYAGVVVFTVKPQFAPGNFTMQKTVKVAGTTGWKESVDVAPGTKIRYKLEFKNTGATKLNNVVIKDMLPKNISFVPGTVSIYNASNPNGALVKDGDKLVTTGISVGSYTGGGSNAIVNFDAIVAKADALACGVNKLHNIASATPEANTPKEDGADVTVTKECEQPKPVEACNLDTKKIETVDGSKIDNIHYTKDLTKCAETPAPKEITVCRLENKKYPVVIKETEFDKTKYSTNPEDCKAPVETPKCEVPGKENLPVDSPDCTETPKTPMCTVPGKENMPADSKDCKPAPAEVTELPHTGIADGIFSLIGLGSLVGVTTAYIASRRVQ